MTTWEEVGGRDFDYRITQFLLQKAEEKFNKDLSTNARVVSRLSKEARKAKEILSANKEAYIRVESLLPDQDFSTQLTRAEFETMCQDLFEQTILPVRKILAETKVNTSNIDIEVIGGGSRCVKTNEYLSDLFTEVGRHLNGDESALQGAMLYAATSSAGKKSSFIVKDTVNRPINIICDLPDFEPYTLIKAESKRAHKNINVFANDTFNCQLYYDHPESLSTGIPTNIDKFEIYGFPDFSSLNISPDEPQPSVRVRFDIDNRGTISCTEANLRVSVVESNTEQPTVQINMEEQPVEPIEPVTEEEQQHEPTEPEPTPEPEPSPEDSETEQAQEDEQENQEQQEDQDQEEQQEQQDDQEQEQQEAAENVPSVKVRHFDLKLKKYPNVHELTSADIGVSRSRLIELNKQDQQRLRRAEVKNELESYVYATLDFLDNEATQAVSTSEERESFATALQEAGDWLYDDGFDASLEEYEEKLNGLVEVGNAILLRVQEVENRPLAASTFHEWKAVVFSTLETIVEERNVGEEERDDLKNEINQIESWLEEKQEEQSRLAPHEQPAWLSRELTDKMLVQDNTLKRLTKRRIRTPTPTPTPTPESNQPDEEAGSLNFDDIDFANINFDDLPNDTNIDLDDLDVKGEEKPHHEEL